MATKGSMAGLNKSGRVTQFHSGTFTADLPPVLPQSCLGFVTTPHNKSLPSLYNNKYINFSIYIFVTFCYFK